MFARTTESESPSLRISHTKEKRETQYLRVPELQSTYQTQGTGLRMLPPTSAILVTSQVSENCQLTDFR